MDLVHILVKHLRQSGMITFKKIGKHIIASYETNNDNSWLFDRFDVGDTHSFHKTYTFSATDYYEEPIRPNPNSHNMFGRDEPQPIDFIFATLKGDYYKVSRGVLVSKFDIYIHIEVSIDNSLFYTDSDVSIFKKIEGLINEDIYIGGINIYAIAEVVFRGMIANFPNQYEKKLYVDARVGSVIKENFPSTIDAEQRLSRYVSKKVEMHGPSLPDAIHDNELQKFLAINDKLTSMLADEISYSEKQWQKEILEIILLLYPKYIKVLENVEVHVESKRRYLDFLLIDVNGNVDVIEIKKPFDNVIMTKGHYRNNFIPLRELSGTVMQIEKYIYYLNRWSEKGEKKLTEKYASDLPQQFKIKITNPCGIIIMGRENNLTAEQKSDFEIVKRKYKNVVDIMTYDSLLLRLKITIDQVKKR
ncbi:MAG: DUF4263 domain-containing protein [Flavobacterium sp.]|nr:MAG: DUF4263 domain-containing protein [Flavobacterium sp.]